MAIELPNIFDYATSELTQDGFFAYFFKWAENNYYEKIEEYSDFDDAKEKIQEKLNFILHSITK